MRKITQELTVLGGIRKRTLFAAFLLGSLLLSGMRTALDNVIGGVLDGMSGTHQHDPRK